MTVALTREIESAIAEQAWREGTTPENLVLEVEKIVLDRSRFVGQRHFV